MEFTSFFFGILATVGTFTVVSNLFLLVKISKLSRQYRESVRNSQDDFREVYRYAEEKHDEALRIISAEVKDVQSVVDQLVEFVHTKSKTV